MTDSFSLKFFLKEVDQNLSKIFVRIIVNRKKAELSTSLKINPNDWNEETQKSFKDKRLNEELVFIESNLHEIRRQIQYLRKPLSATLIKKLYTGEEKDKFGLLEYFEDFISRIENLPKEYKVGTVSHYRTTLKHLKDYCTLKKCMNIMVKEIDHKFISNFDYFLCTNPLEFSEKPMERNTANKQHSRFRTVLLKAQREDVISKNPYKEFPLKYDKPQRAFLTDEELKKITEHKLGENKSLERVRDLFLFSVYTGLRYSDAISLTVSHIKKDKEGKFWIEKIQAKTRERLNIPLLDKAIEIYNKYDDHDRKVTGFVFSKISNQKINTYLKTIAELAEIDKELTHHVARHTFATTITLSNHVPLEIVSKLLGHTDIKTTQIYAKITNNYLSEVTSQLNKKIG
jgi:integrase/recombinase XerD